jgi:hypothetical protein
MGLDYNSIDQDPQLLRMEAAPQVRIQLRKYADGRIKSSGVFARQQFEASREASRSATSGAPPKRANVPSLKDLEVSSDTDDSIIGASHAETCGGGILRNARAESLMPLSPPYRHHQAGRTAAARWCGALKRALFCGPANAQMRKSTVQRETTGNACHSTHPSHYSVCLTAA